MDYLTLGKTNLRASKVGLGCGGFSRLGQSYGSSEEDSVAVVRAAIEMGINYIDTATAYNTEAIVGKALRDFNRDEIVVSSKFGISNIRDGEAVAAEWVADAVDASLERLQTDYIDVYHIHGPSAEDLGLIRSQVMPELLKARDAGKIRHIAISEAFGSDTDHRMFQACTDSDPFEVAMVGFNLLNPSARKTVLPRLIKSGVGTEIMFAVRNVLYKPDLFRKAIAGLVDSRAIDVSVFDGADPVQWFFGAQDPDTMAETAYRYAAHEQGADILLTGTGNIAHLKQNVAWTLRGPLAPEVKARFDSVFGDVATVSGN